MGGGWRRLPAGAARTRHGDVALTLDDDGGGGAPPPRSARTRLLRDFRRPPFLEEEQAMLRTGTIQFFLGPRCASLGLETPRTGR